MKKILTSLLSVALILSLCLSLAGCGSDKTPSGDQGSAEQVESTNPVQEKKAYGIGETATCKGYEITINRVLDNQNDVMMKDPEDGYTYIRIYYTFKNVSDEPLRSPKNTAFYLVYEEGATGSECKMAADRSTLGMESEYESDRYFAKELAPGESLTKCMMYLNKTGEKNVTMHYYSGYINVAPDLVFKFTME